MNEVFRQYGGVLIAAAATSAFLVLMGNIVPVSYTHLKISYLM